jgi:prevent-host-death family protein
MTTVKVNVAEIKSKLSEYLERALAGERIVICRHNAPIVELRPIASGSVEPRPIGPVAGRPTFEVPPSFFEPLSEEDLDAWEGVRRLTDPVADSPVSHVAEAQTPYAPRPQRPKRRR